MSPHPEMKPSQLPDVLVQYLTSLGIELTSITDVSISIRRANGFERKVGH